MGIIYLTRQAHFCAAHRLHSDELSASENQRVFGKCNNPNGHGHNYILEVTVRGKPDPKTGMLINLVDLKQIIEDEVIEPMDHRNLNVDVPVMTGIIPTAENLTIVIWKLLEKKLPAGILYEVKLRETENNVSVYRGEKA